MKKVAFTVFLTTMMIASAFAGIDNPVGSPRMRQNKAINTLLKSLDKDPQAQDAVLAYHVNHSPILPATNYVIDTLAALKKENPTFKISPAIVQKAYMGATVQELIALKENISPRN